MFGKQHRLRRLVGTAAVAAAVLLPAAQAAPTTEWGEYGMPRAMPSDYAAHFAAQIEPGQYGMPRPLPSDYEPVGDTSGGSGFDWGDAGIGAGAALGLVLVALAAGTLRRGGRLEQA